MVQRHAVADFEITNPRFPDTDFDNRAGGFVAEDARRRDGAVMDFIDVGRADAADGDLDEQLVRANARDGHGFEAQVVDAAINNGAHGFRDGEHTGFLTQRHEDAKPQRILISLRLKNFAPLR
jgi:hypothetical protein